MRMFRELLLQLFVRLCVLMFGAVVVPAAAWSATGDAIPSYSHPVMHIPRLDVEGYGSVTIDLLLEDRATLTFSIASKQTAAPTLSPGGTFDTASGELHIPLVKTGTSWYQVTMQALPNDQFRVTSVKQTMITGQNAYQQMCASCHGDNGLGGPVSVPLKNCKWCTSATTLSGYIASNMPLGNIGKCTGSCATTVAGYILTAFNTTRGTEVEKTLSAIQQLPLDATLRKAALQLLSRLPTQAETAQVQQGGEQALKNTINTMMQESAFYDRLSEIFNDYLHTNRYMSSNSAEAAVSLMGNYPTARWYDPGSDKRGADYAMNQQNTNNSIATEPLELINYIVKNNKPATEMLTADYFMVNGYSAKSYGITNITFTNEWDPKEFRPARLPNTPHAGVLTSLMFLNRYPTSATNRNRARARVVYDIFLDVDILALDGARPDGSAVDTVNTAPTMQNPDCVKCHTLLDPVASSFQDWDLRGRYIPPRTWPKDMFQSGFNGVPTPATASNELQWLATQLANDPRFDDAMVRVLYKGLSGQEPLEEPGAGATTSDLEAYQAEHNVLAAAKAKYLADNRNLKTLIRELLMTPYWRASGLQDASFSQIHDDTGAAVILSPEQLHRKLKAVFGFEWRGPLDQYSANQNVFAQARLLSARNYYQQLYGGIDSLRIMERLTDPNGLMVQVQERMANEMACYAVPNDFMSPASHRRLFPQVETTTKLDTPQNQALVKANIQHLHQHLLGETVALTDAELASTYELFSKVLREGQANIVSKLETQNLPSSCARTKDMQTGASLNANGKDGRLLTDPNYTIRAWMAVVAYLLADYRFLYQ